MQSRREYNLFHNALDTSEKPSVKRWYNSSQSGNEDKRRGKNLNYLYFFFFGSRFSACLLFLFLYCNRFLQQKTKNKPKYFIQISLLHDKKKRYLYGWL